MNALFPFVSLAKFLLVSSTASELAPSKRQLRMVPRSIPTCKEGGGGVNIQLRRRCRAGGVHLGCCATVKSTCEIPSMYMYLLYIPTSLSSSRG